MLSSIHPLGERGRGFTFGQTASAFVVGSTIGGLVTGAIFGGAGALLSWLLEAGGLGIGPTARLVIVAGAAVLATVVERTNTVIPSVRRQVNEDWLHEFRGWVYGLGFGFQLGTGLMTFITSAALLLWLVTILFAGSFVASLAIGGAFGLARGLGILAVRRVRSPSDLVRFHKALHARSPLVWRLGSFSLAALGAIAGLAALTQWAA